jgi:hypothetical protein
VKTNSGTTANVQSAVDGTKSAVTLSETSTALYLRPSAALGLFATIYIAESGFLPVFSAGKGVQAQMLLHSTQDVTQNDTFALLQEFGSVLSVDVPDILNRSSDRAGTLNDYLQGLSNITARSKTRETELESELKVMDGNRRTAQSEVAAIQKVVNQATKDKDYATAAAQQEKLAEAQNKFSKIDTQRKLTQNVATTFKQLIALSDKRLLAIQQNRAIIIAGLSVVQLPGIEDLDLIMKGNTRGKAGNYFGL